MRRLAQLLAVWVFLTSSWSFGKHVTPSQIDPIHFRGIRYVVPNDNGLRAYVIACDDATGRKLWKKTLFRHWYIPPFGTECMHYEYVTSVVLEKNQLVITSERGKGYRLDPTRRTVHRLKD